MRRPQDTRQLPHAGRPASRWPGRRARPLRRAAGPASGSAYDDTLFTGPAASPDVGGRLPPRRRGQPDHRAVGRRGPGATRARSPGRADPPAAAAAALRRARCAPGASRVTGGPAGPAPAATRRAAGAGCGAPSSSRWSSTSSRSATTRGPRCSRRHVALAEGRPASFDGAAQAVRSVVRDLGVPLGGAVLRDGSGLSRGNRLRVATLLRVLAAGRGRPRDPSSRGSSRGCRSPASAARWPRASRCGRTPASASCGRRPAR